MIRFRVNILVLVGAFAGILGDSVDAEEAANLFEPVRLVLQEHCSKCHSEAAARNDELQGGLLLDSFDGWQRGGESGPVIVPGDAEASLLIKALKYQDEFVQMPPDGKLPDAVIDAFFKWIDAGAADPRRSDFKIDDSYDLKSIRASHWAYQPLSSPSLPRAENVSGPDTARWLANPIDRFIARGLAAKKVAPADRASLQVWLRRVYLDLIGLPPTPEQQADVATDTSETARARVVDQLLASPHYGERWGRHWLDVARYAETRGYEDDDLMPLSWLYRDWVIKAFNADMPYDQFVRHQLAGDEIEGADRESLIATMMLSIGPYDTQGSNQNEHPRSVFDQMDDIVATTSQAFMGMTVQCARCHDHKFDPVSQKDYYRLLAAFEPLDIQRIQISREGIDLTSPGERERIRIHNEELDLKLAPLAAVKEEFEVSALKEIVEIGILPGRKKTQLKPYLTKRLLEAFETKPGDRTDQHVRDIKDHQVQATADINALIKDDKQRTEQYAKLVKDVTDLDSTRANPMWAFIFTEQETPPQTHLRIRGEFNNLGEVVDFALPEVLNWSSDSEASSSTEPPTDAPKTTRRRTAIANWLTGEGRALTARVMANRIWQYHFGKGFVENANNLSVSGGQPTHPDLLNWLADQLIAGEWKLKPLHRMIVLSETYSQSRANPDAQQTDPLNELYSRWPQHRLDAEVIRDSILAVSGQLNPQMEGPSIFPEMDRIQNGSSSDENWGKSDQYEAARRSVYVFAKRAFQLPELGSMGQPDPAFSCEKRDIATTPVQSLLLLNGKFAWQQAEHLAARLRAEVNASDHEEIVDRAYQLALGRLPHENEREWSVQFLSEPAAENAPDTLATYCLVVLNSSEFAYQN